MSRNRGYILVEAAVALAILSVGAMTVHRTIQEAVRTRGQAQDFTRARFLLDQKMGEITSTPQLVEGGKSGTFEGMDSRFAWTSSIRRVNLPVPEAPLTPPPPNEPVTELELPPTTSYMAHVRVTVRWTRSGMSFEESYETLLPPEQLWQPPPAPRRNP